MILQQYDIPLFPYTARKLRSCRHAVTAPACSSAAVSALAGRPCAGCRLQQDLPRAADRPISASGCDHHNGAAEGRAVFGEWVANLDGYVNAQIQPQVTGYLIRQNYKEGSQVRKGQILYEIDPRPFQAAARPGQGTVGPGQGATAAGPDQHQARYSAAEARAIARSQLDNDLQTQAANEATVPGAKGRGRNRPAESWLDEGALPAGRHRRSSPPPRSAAWSTQSTVLTTVSQVEPIKVYFAISEQEYLALSEKAREGGAADLLHSASRVPIETDALERQRISQQGHVSSSSIAQVNQLHRHHSRGRGVSQSAKPAAPRPVRQGSCADGVSSVALSWCRSALSRSCKAPIRSPSSTLTTRCTSSRCR